MKILTLKGALFAAVICLFCGCQPTQSTDQAESAQSDKIDFGAKVFNYYPEAPVNGKLKGVVVLGGSGLDAFIIELDETKRWSLKDTDFANSKLYEQEMDVDLLDLALVAYIEKFGQYSIFENDIHFIASSTASRFPEMLEIAKTNIKRFGFDLKSINKKEEAKYAYLSVMPATYATKAFIMDIGSGNTKISWKANGEIETRVTFGSKYYLDSIDDQTVMRDIEKQLSTIPDELAKTCFLIGGASYELAKMDEGYSDRYTVLMPLAEYQTNNPKAQAGLNILKAVQRAKKTKNFIFDWESNFGIGYLLEQPY